MEKVIVIPARYGSSRFPGKPLANIKGKSLIRRVWEISQNVVGVDEVLIATDDERILEHARSFGARAVLTDPGCRNGTERTLAAVQLLTAPPRFVINLQGDAVLTPPKAIEAVIEQLDQGAQLATVAVRLEAEQLEQLVDAKTRGITTGTLVVFDRCGRALYFSKAFIPYLRDSSTPLLPVHRHIGIYGYELETLNNLMHLPPGPLETTEKLEQLRALENGIPIQVAVADLSGRTLWSIDRPEDIEVVEQIIEQEGELLCS